MKKYILAFIMVFCVATQCFATHRFPKSMTHVFDIYGTEYYVDMPSACTSESGNLVFTMATANDMDEVYTWATVEVNQAENIYKIISYSVRIKAHLYMDNVPTEYQPIKQGSVVYHLNNYMVKKRNLT